MRFFSIIRLIPFPSRILMQVLFPLIEPEPQVLNGDLIGAGIGVRDRCVLGYPALGEVIRMRNFPVLIAYLDRERPFVFREQGALSRCRTITPHHADPLFKPEIEGNSPFKVDEKRGILAFQPHGSGWTATLPLAGTFQVLREGGDLKKAGHIPATHFHAERILPVQLI
jgi:hypothetical protein